VSRSRILKLEKAYGLDGSVCRTCRGEYRVELVETYAEPGTLAEYLEDEDGKPPEPACPACGGPRDAIRLLEACRYGGPRVKPRGAPASAARKMTPEERAIWRAREGEAYDDEEGDE